MEQLKKQPQELGKKNSILLICVLLVFIFSSSYLYIICMYVYKLKIPSVSKKLVCEYIVHSCSIGTCLFFSVDEIGPGKVHML